MVLWKVDKSYTDLSPLRRLCIPWSITNSNGMMIKWDLSKAYDQLNWDYLNNVLKSSEFDQRWVNWISIMVSSLVYSILLNGSPTQSFNPSHGLRQVDSIFLLLFIIIAEDLVHYLKMEARTFQLKGSRLWGNDLPITHQQFVDDIKLFCVRISPNKRGPPSLYGCMVN